ncbi:MAG: hypothetical protein EON55_01480 [Alphaproteobacteria bacterium]|nr:MAG: hypothetical protein EON55_01480 [Alphaproteobacteria bacterium]
MIDPKRPETDPAETPPGARSYEDLPVSGRSQGSVSRGATEPSDIGAPRNDEGITGHEAFDKARAETQQRK